MLINHISDLIGSANILVVATKYILAMITGMSGKRD